MLQKEPSISKRESFSSSEFIERLKRKEESAVLALVETYHRQLFHAALGVTRDKDLAEELVQKTWITFLDVVPRFEGRSHIRTFLLGVLYKKGCELRREQHRLAEHDPIDDFFEERVSPNGGWSPRPLDPEKFYQSAQIRELIEECLEVLPTSQKMAFYLREIKGEAIDDISASLDFSANNVRVLLFRARNKLRTCIEGKNNADL